MTADLRKTKAQLISELKSLRLELKAVQQTDAREKSDYASIQVAQFLRIADDAIISMDESCRIILFNDGAEKIFGCAAEDVLNQPIDILIPSEYRTAHGPHIEKFSRAKNASRPMAERAEVFGLRRNGERFPAEASISKIEVEGKLLYTVILRDISIRKKDERKLQESEQGLALSQRIAHLGSWNWDIEGGGLTWSDEVYRIFGYRPQEVEATYEEFLKHVHPEDRKNVEQNITAAVERDSPYSVEHRIVKKDGSIRIVHEIGYVERNEAGRAVHMLGNVHDITERKQAERKLQESEQQVRLLLDSTAEAIYGFDTSGNCTFINPACLAMLEYEKPEDCLGHNMHQLIHHSHRDGSPYPEQECPISKAYRSGGQAHVDDEVFWRADGTSFDVEFWAHPIIQDGNTVGCVVTFLDITDRKIAERELRQAQKMEVVGQLTGGVAHDFNNILQVITGFSHIARKSLDNDDPNAGHLDKVLQAAQRAADLTQQLLAFSRQQVHQPRPVEINELIANLFKMLGRVIAENINLSHNFQEHLSLVMADAGMIEQVLLNLCINARDAMPGGGQIAISTEDFAASKEFCENQSWAVPGNYVLISVSDTGTGMSREIQDKIFEPFFTTKEVGKGTGLGLAMAYGTIQQHGGDILVYSEEGVGTTFKIYLPTAEPGEQGMEDAIESSAPGGTETILVAEDEHAVLGLVTSLLEDKGYSVIQATNGLEALDKIAEYADSVDLVILDIVMPQLGGREVFEKIKEINPALPVIFSTGYAANAIDKEFLESNDLRLISKPFTPNELYLNVREAIDA